MAHRYILVLNGPNLNLLGTRQPEIYGAETLDDINRAIADSFSGTDIRFAQHNGEGALIDALHGAAADGDCMGVVLNAGAYTHYSYALADAVAAISKPVVEVHMSNIFAREEFRSKSVIAPACAGSISGFGAYSYHLAVQALIDYGKKG